MPQKRAVVLAASVPVAIGVCWWLYKQRIKAKTNNNLHSQKLKQNLTAEVTSASALEADSNETHTINIAPLLSDNANGDLKTLHTLEKPENSFQDQIITHENIHQNENNMTALHISNSVNDLPTHESKSLCKTEESCIENCSKDDAVNEDILQPSVVTVDSAVEVSYKSNENLQSSAISDAEVKVSEEIAKEDFQIKASSYDSESSEYRTGHSDASSEITSTTSNSELNSECSTEEIDSTDCENANLRRRQNTSEFDDSAQTISENENLSSNIIHLESSTDEALITSMSDEGEESSENRVIMDEVISVSKEPLKNGIIQKTNSWHEEMVQEEKIKSTQNGDTSVTGDVVNNVNVNNNIGLCNGTTEKISEEIKHGKESKMKLDDVETDSTKKLETKKERHIYIEFPSELVGLLIGKQGKNIKAIKERSKADITVRSVTYSEEVQILDIQGAESAIDKAIYAIERRFPSVPLLEPEHDPTFTQPLDSRSAPIIPHGVPPHSYPVPDISQLQLPEGLLVEVVVSAISECNKIFVQQYTHPTYYALANLEQAMLMCYNQPNTPPLLTPVQLGLVCVVQQGDMWFRAQVIQADDDNVMLQFVDYGGFATIPISLVRQIRADLISLPFQAVSCILDSIAPPEGKETFSEDSAVKLQEMLKEGSFQVFVTNYSSSGEPIVKLYKSGADKTVTCINDALVESGVAGKMSMPHYAESNTKCNDAQESSKSSDNNINVEVNQS